jgi:hypothetical protein
VPLQASRNSGWRGAKPGREVSVALRNQAVFPMFALHVVTVGRVPTDGRVALEPMCVLAHEGHPR